MTTGNSGKRFSTVVQARHSDLDRITAILAQALARDPFLRWAFPGDAYDSAAARFPAMLAEPAIAHGCVWLVDGKGAAIWYPPGTGPAGASLDRLLRPLIPERRRADYLAVLRAVARQRPLVPHWQLALIGVLPEARGQGVGRALIEAGLAACDRAGQPVFIDATNPESAGIYDRFGFNDLAQIDIGSAPGRQLLWRTALP